jgi:uncharacterized membrane protein
MDKIAERLSEWFGSTPFILFHVVWFALWYPLGGTTDLLTLVVSLEAIFLALFILRAENIQASRMERYIKEAKAAVKEDLDKSDEVLDNLDEVLDFLREDK